MSRVLVRAFAFAVALAVANGAGLAPGGVPRAAAAWGGSISVYIDKGDGAGRVTSDDGGIDCTLANDRTSGDCDETYVWADFLDNVLVGITYTPATGSYVCLVSTSSCTQSGAPVTYNLEFKRGQTNQAVLSPTFWLKTYDVQVNITGPGTVTSNGTSCAIASGMEYCGRFKHGSTATFVGTPDAGYPFNYWGGTLCTGHTSGQSCSFTLTSQPTEWIGVVFGRVYLLTKVDGGGKVCVDQEVVCLAGGTSWPKEKNTEVTLYAKADPGWTFVGWTGPCQGKPSTCLLTMTADADVTASFQRLATPKPSATPVVPKPTPTPRPTPGTSPRSTAPNATPAPSATPATVPSPGAGASPASVGSPAPGIPGPSGTPTNTTGSSPSARTSTPASVTSPSPTPSAIPVASESTDGGPDGMAFAMVLLVILIALAVGIVLGRRREARVEPSTR